MADWQVGDLALCVDARVKFISGYRCDGNGLEEGRIYRVVASSQHPLTRVLVLHLDPMVNGDGSAASRFRKIRPDEHKSCEPEFVTLLKRSKRKVAA